MEQSGVEKMIAFVILNYNTWEMTFRCVDSIFETCKQNYTIYIVDNGSPNDSFERLNEQYHENKNVVLIQSENLGYARGNNTGIKAAMNDGHNIIAITNNDVIFLDESIERMYTFLNEHEDASVAAPYILSPEGDLQNLPTLKPIKTSDYFLYNTKLSNFASSKAKMNYEQEYYLQAASIKDVPIPIYKFSGCCFMATREMWEKVGFFDENTFLYYEEDILSNKMHTAGCKAYYLPNAKIVHHHGLTTGKDNLFVDTEMVKSELYFLSKYHQLNFLGLFFIYMDRAITPIMKKIRKRYNLTGKDYLAYLRKTWLHFIKCT
ncbi:glycosyltransferase family 2 protein [Neobacillus muris]|uniref:glycosyltransferase family 2 protein n=1 Tax=Neobacillus muris TaxID=2941334 RepID=UPI00204004CF|nr:glycosyltransferase family 2 protein [Neobacillus muris]